MVDFHDETTPEELTVFYDRLRHFFYEDIIYTRIYNAILAPKNCYIYLLYVVVCVRWLAQSPPKQSQAATHQILFGNRNCFCYFFGFECHIINGKTEVLV